MKRAILVLLMMALTMSALPIQPAYAAYEDADYVMGEYDFDSMGLHLGGQTQIDESDGQEKGVYAFYKGVGIYVSGDPYGSRHKFGLISVNGEKLGSIYDEIYDFSEDLALAFTINDTAEMDRTWVYLNLEGQAEISLEPIKNISAYGGQFTVSSCGSFRDGRAWVRYEIESGYENLPDSIKPYGALFAYIDKSGKKILPADKDEYYTANVSDFSDGVAFVTRIPEANQPVTFGIEPINTNGEVLFSPQSKPMNPSLWTRAGESFYRDGYAYVAGSNGDCFIDKRGNELKLPVGIAPAGDAANNGMIRIRREITDNYRSFSYGFYDIDSNKVTIEPPFGDNNGTMNTYFSEGLLAFSDSESDLWGYKDKDGKWVITPQFDKAGPFSEDLAWVIKNGKIGYIDKGANMVIPFEYDDGNVYSFRDGYSIARKNGKYIVLRNPLTRSGESTPTQRPAGEILGATTEQFVMGEDNYSFPNFFDSFGYEYSIVNGLPVSQYRIPYTRYLELYSPLLAWQNREYDGVWSGSCFGIASTALLFNAGVLNTADYGMVNVRERGESNAELTELIELYFISQRLPMIQNEVKLNKNQYSALIEAMENANGQGITLLLQSRSEDGQELKHAVVAYDIQPLTGDSYKLSIYDSNFPNEDKYLEMSASSGIQKNWDTRLAKLEWVSFVSTDTIETAVKNALAFQTTSFVDGFLYIVIPSGAVIIDIVSGRLIEDISEAYEVVTAGYMPGAPQARQTMWCVPNSEAYRWRVVLDENTVNRDIVFFDDKSSIALTADSAGGSVTGNAASVEIQTAKSGNFTIEHMTDETIEAPLVLTGNGSNVTATANGNDVQISGDAEITTKYYGEPASWAKTAIEDASELGLATEELLIGFQKATTRIEFCRAAVNFLRIYGYDVDSVTPKLFSDTNDHDIGIAATLGITSGTDAEKNLFSPNTSLTREQAATMLRNVMDIIGADTTPPSVVQWTDAGEMSSWAQTAADVMCGAKIMNGTSTTELIFSPKTPYTHEQSITTLVNLWNHVKK